MLKSGSAQVPIETFANRKAAQSFHKGICACVSGERLKLAGGRLTREHSGELLAGPKWDETKAESK